MIARIKEANRLTREFIRSEFHDQLWMSGAAFAVLLVAGFAIGMIMTDLADNFIMFFSQNIANSGIMDNDGKIHLLPLLGSNLRAAILTISYGVIPFIYLPALSLGVNSLLLGFFAAYYVRNGMSMLFYLAAIIPHGIFELPALVLSIALGLYLCKAVSNYAQNNVKGTVSTAVMNIMRVFLLRAAPLFILASILESYVTPWVITLF